MQSLSENDSPLRIDAVLTGLSSEYARRLGDLLRGGLNGILTRTMSFPSASSGRPLMVLAAAQLRCAELDRTHFQHLRAAAAMPLVCDPARPAQIPDVVLAKPPAQRTQLRPLGSVYRLSAERAPRAAAFFEPWHATRSNLAHLESWQRQPKRRVAAGSEHR